MNNTTVKEFNLKIKLRGDNIYDLYVDGEHYYRIIVKKTCNSQKKWHTALVVT